MEDSNPNKINIDDGDEEDEINTSTYCPYKKVTNFLVVYLEVEIIKIFPKVIFR